LQLTPAIIISIRHNTALTLCVGQLQVHAACNNVAERKKERKIIYIAPFCTKVHTKRSGMDHTVLPAKNTMPAFPSWHSPDVTTTATEAADIRLQLTTADNMHHGKRAANK